ncbi:MULTISPECIES: hypothetical protein [Bacteroides]|uniref:hypothetical protein n=1 Tax=Bacteroides TaxID=816 RepID=UPI00216467B3|nr:MULTISPECIES: hypothetical protein [Bacteroides]MCS2571271.1 hypothetical protein [Bacteroides ovatus]MCS3200677.1 hypothetical protein [Candidatus Bacteroides intestinigallinarum]UVR40834.1 hypothetical protein NXV29_12410 [Bacteroides ovatus]
MKKKSISELIHFFVRHPLQNSLQMKFWRWLVSPADAEDKEEAIQEEWMNIIAEPDEATRRSWYEVRRKAGLANPVIKPHWEIKPLLRIASMILIPLFSVLLSWYYINDYTDSCKLVEYIVPMGERGRIDFAGWDKGTDQFGEQYHLPEKLSRRYTYCLSFRRGEF